MSARKKHKAKKTGRRAPARKARARRRAASRHKERRARARRSSPRSAAASRQAAKARKRREREQRARAAQKKKRDADRLKKQKQAERVRLAKKQKAERVRAAAQKQAERERADKRKQAERERREREARRARDQREREKKREREDRERKKAKERAERERERLKKQKEIESVRLAKQKEAERAAAQKAREEASAKARAEKEAERARARAEKEAERARQKAEKEAAREEARRAKEEERARKEAEREAYRKAKEAERERLRAEREAARRALEGKVARATKRAQRAGGLGRGASAIRVYRPDSIPDQSGTTRRVEGAVPRLVRPAPPPPPLAPFPPTPAPVAAPAVGAEAAPAVGAEAAPGGGAAAPADGQAKPPPPLERVEERYTSILERLKLAPEEFRREYEETLDMSWIYHDSALEGVVYTFQELKTAIDPNITVVPDSSLQPVCEEIRRHKSAIDLVRDLGEKKRTPITVDVIKKIYLTLHPSEGDLKTVKYRRDIPQHRLYFHEYAAPDKIAYKVRQIVDWLNGPEPKKIKHPVRVAARVHYDLLRVFPFPQDSGKVARLLMNLILLRSGYPPAIIHSTERQRYYEALKGALPVIVGMVNEAIINALMSIEKRLDDSEAKPRPLPPVPL